MLCKKTCLFMELNAFSASTSQTASVLFVPNMSCTGSTAASHPVSCPPHSYKFPTAFVTSSFTILMTTFPVILGNTSPTPICRKPGFLSRGTSLLAINVSSDVVSFSISLMQIYLMKSAIALQEIGYAAAKYFPCQHFSPPINI